MPGDWHLVHLGARAAGGFGLVMAEASAISPEGRITVHDAGIWNDQQATAWRRVTAFIASHGSVPGIQLAHAGRKASVHSFWQPGTGSVPTAEGGWETIGPSPTAFAGLRAPRELTVAEIRGLVGDFAAAAQRADDAGFDVVEIHAAHGYLLHEFLSPLSNQRTDDYGGSLANRARVLLETVQAVRQVWPEGKPLLVRFSGTDWTPGGWTIEETAQVARWVNERGVDLIDVSSGGNVADAPIPLAPGYQVPLAGYVREHADVPTCAVGLITDPHHAAQIVAEGAADAVMLARAALREPSWPYRAAHELGLDQAAGRYPRQYLRGAWPHDRDGSAGEDARSA